MKNFRWLLSGISAVGVMLTVGFPAQAGTIVLEGSDAIGFHCCDGSGQSAVHYAASVIADLTHRGVA